MNNSEKMQTPSFPSKSERIKNSQLNSDSSVENEAKTKSINLYAKLRGKIAQNKQGPVF